jgi:hypothetical protein
MVTHLVVLYEDLGGAARVRGRRRVLADEPDHVHEELAGGESKEEENGYSV